MWRTWGWWEWMPAARLGGVEWSRVGLSTSAAASDHTLPETKPVLHVSSQHSRVLLPGSASSVLLGAHPRSAGTSLLNLQSGLPAASRTAGSRERLSLHLLCRQPGPGATLGDQDPWPCTAWFHPGLPSWGMGKCICLQDCVLLPGGSRS